MTEGATYGYHLAAVFSNANSAPTGAAINQQKVSISMGLVEKLHFAQFANGGGLVSQISLLPVGPREAVHAKLNLSEDEGAPVHVVLNGQIVFWRNRDLPYSDRGWCSIRKWRRGTDGGRIRDRQFRLAVPG